MERKVLAVSAGLVFLMIIALSFQFIRRLNNERLIEMVAEQQIAINRLEADSAFCHYKLKIMTEKYRSLTTDFENISPSTENVQFIDSLVENQKAFNLFQILNSFYY